MTPDRLDTGTYQDPCPKCGARLVAVSKGEFIEHLRENGETLAARIHKEMVVSAQTHPNERDCAGANGGDY